MNPSSREDRSRLGRVPRMWWCLGAACFLLFGIDETRAQAPDAARVAALAEERELIKTLEQEIPEIRGTTWDYGGWYRFSFTKFNDLDKDRELISHELRLWGSLSIGDVQQIYVRGRVNLDEWAPGDSFDGNDHDLVGPILDQGWYRLRLGRLAKNYLKQDWPVDVDLKLGRQYIEVGRGVVLSEIIDAASVEIGNFYFNAQLFAGKSMGSTHNLDVSAPRYWHDDRQFVGFQASMKNVLPRHEPYVFALLVDDRNDYEPAIPGQAFGYDPNYFGIGSKGYLIPNLRYWTEFIWETGKSHATGSLRREKIDAHAFVAGAEYLLTSFPMRPRFEAEFGVGSGDGDRASPTTTVFGNQPFTQDKGFLAYGYHDTGSAFAARLANLQVLRVTGAFHPLDWCEHLRNLEVGASYYWFNKDKKAGGISDFSADLADRDLGTELDLFANWRITSDLLWTIRWGKFEPGDAYSDKDDRQYVLTSITYSF